MPLHMIQGDLLRSDCDIIAHGCNCFCTMGAGIARAIAVRWPKVVEVDRQTKAGDRDKLGTTTFVPVGEGRIVANLYTQYYYGMGLQLDYQALEQALVALSDNASSELKIGMPMIGCGLAGGEWKRVRSIIARVFCDRDVYVYYL